MRPIGIVFLKELVDLIRDRRTMISMIVVPVVLMPVLVLGMAFLTARSISKAQQQPAKIMVLGGSNSPVVMKAIRELEMITILPSSQNFTNLISEKKIRAAVQLPDDFDAALERGDPLDVLVYKHEGDMKSGIAARVLTRFFSQLSKDTVRQRLMDRQLPESLIRPFEIEQVNVAKPSQVSGELFGALLPYIVILLCMTGGMYPAMDLTAGEKERGTMETLLCSPVSRTHLVLGKFLMVLLAAITTAVMALGSMALSYLIVGKSAGGMVSAGSGMMQFSLDPASILMVFVMILPVAFLIAACELVLSVFARSFKEAQSYLTPLMFAVLIPTLASMTPGIELNLKLAFIPIMNTSLVCKQIMTSTWNWDMIALIFLSTCAYAGLALWAAVRMFNKESVLMRS